MISSDEFVFNMALAPTVIWNAAFGFFIWVLFGWLFCVVLLTYYEGKRSFGSFPTMSEKHQTNKKITKISAIGGVLLGFGWLAHYLLISIR
jgi:hypothetical protein